MAKGCMKCCEICGSIIEGGICVLQSCCWLKDCLINCLTCGRGLDGCAASGITLCTSEEEEENKDFPLPECTDRKPTDLPSVALFCALFVGVCWAMNRGVTLGNPRVYSNGVDSWGNICGIKNGVISGVDYSGKDMTEYSKVVIGNFLTTQLLEESIPKESIMTMCVKRCPQVSKDFKCGNFLKENSIYGATMSTWLCNTREDFGDNSDIDFHELHNRCIPKKGSSTQQKNQILNMYSKNWIHNFVNDCNVCAAELTWVTLIAIAFTIVYLLIIHGAVTMIFWFSVGTFFFGGSISVGFMWYLYNLILYDDSDFVTVFASDDVIVDANETSNVFQKFERELKEMAVSLAGQAPRNVIQGRAYEPGYDIVFRDTAIYSTIVMIIFTMVSLSLGKRNIDASAVLFTEAVDCMLALPWTYFLPLLSFASFSFGLGLWLYTIELITSVFLPDMVVNELTLGESSVPTASYKPNQLYYTWIMIFEVISFYWIVNFILGCQYLLISLACSTWYFTNDKKSMHRPMRVASSRLMKKHLGSAITGSFIIGYFGYLRGPLSLLQSRIAAFYEKSEIRHSVTQLSERKSDSTVSDKSSRTSQPPPVSARTSGSGTGSEGNGTASEESDELGASSKKSSKKISSKESVVESPKKPLRLSKKKMVAASNRFRAEAPAKCLKTTDVVCTPAFWCLNNVLVYISELNYNMVALKGVWFFTGGKHIRNDLAKVPELKGLPTVNSFIMLLGKLTVTLIVVVISFCLLRNKEGVFVYGYPMAAAAFLAYFIAHLFFHAIEAGVCSIYVCYITDMTINDGTADAPYFCRPYFYKEFQKALYQNNSDADLGESPVYSSLHRKPRPSTSLLRSSESGTQSDWSSQSRKRGAAPVVMHQPRKRSSVEWADPIEKTNGRKGNEASSSLNAEDVADKIEESLDGLKGGGGSEDHKKEKAGSSNSHSDKKEKQKHSSESSKKSDDKHKSNAQNSKKSDDKQKSNAQNSKKSDDKQKSNAQNSKKSDDKHKSHEHKKSKDDGKSSSHKHEKEKHKSGGKTEHSSKSKDKTHKSDGKPEFKSKDKSKTDKGSAKHSAAGPSKSHKSSSGKSSKSSKSGKSGGGSVFSSSKKKSGGPTGSSKAKKSKGGGGLFSSFKKSKSGSSKKGGGGGGGLFSSFKKSGGSKKGGGGGGFFSSFKKSGGKRGGFGGGFGRRRRR